MGTLRKRKRFILPGFLLTLFVCFVMSEQSVSSAAVVFYKFEDLRWGLVDKGGRVSLWESDIVPLSSRSEGLVVFGKNKNFPNGGVIDKLGKCCKLRDWVLFDKTKFVDGLALVKDWTKERKCVYCRLDGKRAFKVTFDNAEPFSEGLAAVGDKHSGGNYDWRYIDQTGKTVLPGPYSFAGPFINGRAVVERKAKRFERALIDRKGTKLFEMKNAELSNLSSDGYALLSYRIKNEVGAELKQSKLKEDEFNYLRMNDSGENWRGTWRTVRDLLDKDGKVVARDVPMLNYSEGLGLVPSIDGFKFSDKSGRVVAAWTIKDRPSTGRHPHFVDGFAILPIAKYRTCGYLYRGHEMPSYQPIFGFLDKKSKLLDVKMPQGRFIVDAYPFSEGVSVIKTATIAVNKTARF